MGLTERHWFEDEEPKLTERQLEGIVYENKRAYDNGYVKGYSDRDKEIVRCKDCIYYNTLMGHCKDGRSYPSPDWYCAGGERRVDNG